MTTSPPTDIVALTIYNELLDVAANFVPQMSTVDLAVVASRIAAALRDAGVDVLHP